MLSHPSSALQHLGPLSPQFPGFTSAQYSEGPVSQNLDLCFLAWGKYGASTSTGRKVCSLFRAKKMRTSFQPEGQGPSDSWEHAHGSASTGTSDQGIWAAQKDL